MDGNVLEKKLRMNQGLIDLLNYGFKIAKLLLEDQEGECYPMAVYLDEHEEPTQHLFFSGDDFPLSKTLVEKLETDLKNTFEHERNFMYAIIYDTFVKPVPTENKANALVAKFCDSRNNIDVHYILP